MFVDYYNLLEIDQNASHQEIQTAFKKQAFKWHPDRNHGIDTTSRMQQINEARLILLDSEARKRYDIEYLRFKKHKEQKTFQEKQRKTHWEQQHSHGNHKQKYEREYEYAFYTVEDELLKRWMQNAKKQAVELTQKTIEDFKAIATAGAKAIVKETVVGIKYYLIFSIAGVIIFLLMRSCHT